MQNLSVFLVCKISVFKMQNLSVFLGDHHKTLKKKMSTDHFAVHTHAEIARLHIGHSFITHTFLLKGEEPPICIVCELD